MTRREFLCSAVVLPNAGPRSQPNVVVVLSDEEGSIDLMLAVERRRPAAEREGGSSYCRKESGL